MSAADAATTALLNLIDARVEERLAARLTQLRAELRPSAPAESRMLSVPQAVKQYGLGRLQILDMISSGRLPAIAAKMRGGKQGWRIRREDAERVLAGSRQ